ncbi:hypothetical protein AAHA92_00801 [Salvia divinorum]|uniref:Uncharacterized protein n=1 Tax=Salvia divinorum TaxID=28513 RepID=A0ABD1INL5_SALDI
MSRAAASPLPSTVAARHLTAPDACSESPRCYSSRRPFARTSHRSAVRRSFFRLQEVRLRDLWNCRGIG